MGEWRYSYSILAYSNRWRWVVSLMPQLLYSCTWYWLSPRAIVDPVEHSKISRPSQESNPGHSTHDLSLYQPSYPARQLTPQHNSFTLTAQQLHHLHFVFQSSQHMFWTVLCPNQNPKMLFSALTYWPQLISYCSNNIFYQAGNWRVLLVKSCKWNNHCCAYYLFHAGFLISLLFDPKDGSDMFLRNVSWLYRITWCYIPEDKTLQIMIISFRKLKVCIVYLQGRTSIAACYLGHPSVYCLQLSVKKSRSCIKFLFLGKALIYFN
jgi:hypothetical protein